MYQGEASGRLRLAYGVVHRHTPFCFSACIFEAAKQAAMYFATKKDAQMNERQSIENDF